MIGLAFAFLVTIFTSTIAHSHIECTLLTGDLCIGYPRQYSYYKAGYEGTDESKDRNFVVAASTQTCPARVANIPDYDDAYPMARVSPGQSVTIVWPPRGHTKQPHSPVWIYCDKKSGKQEPTKETEVDLVATLKYDNCVGTDVSWAKCSGVFKIPETWLPGEIRTCQWVWVLNEGQKYVDCFEYQVIGSAPKMQTDNAKALSKLVRILVTN